MTTTYRIKRFRNQKINTESEKKGNKDNKFEILFDLVS